MFGLKAATTAQATNDKTQVAMTGLSDGMQISQQNNANKATEIGDANTLATGELSQQQQALADRQQNLKGAAGVVNNLGQDYANRPGTVVENNYGTAAQPQSYGRGGKVARQRFAEGHLVGVPQAAGHPAQQPFYSASSQQMQQQPQQQQQQPQQPQQPQHSMQSPEGYYRPSYTPDSDSHSFSPHDDDYDDDTYYHPSAPTQGGATATANPNITVNAGSGDSSSSEDHSKFGLDMLAAEGAKGTISAISERVGGKKGAAGAKGAEGAEGADAGAKGAGAEGADAGVVDKAPAAVAAKDVDSDSAIERGVLNNDHTFNTLTAGRAPKAAAAESPKAAESAAKAKQSRYASWLPDNAPIRTYNPVEKMKGSEVGDGFEMQNMSKAAEKNPSKAVGSNNLDAKMVSKGASKEAEHTADAAAKEASKGFVEKGLEDSAKVGTEVLTDGMLAKGGLIGYKEGGQVRSLSDVWNFRDKYASMPFAREKAHEESCEPRNLRGDFGSSNGNLKLSFKPGYQG